MIDGAIELLLLQGQDLRRSVHDLMISTLGDLYGAEELLSDLLESYLTKSQGSSLRQEFEA